MLDARIAAKRLPSSGGLLLRDVALQARPAEIVALLGASGTGKTSTLRILLGLDHDFEGTVCSTAERVGVMFQEPRLLPWLNIADNIRFVVPRDQPSPDIDALLRDVGLPGTGKLYPSQISLGMARRAALARALAVAPDLLILDEPFASLDASISGFLASHLVRLQRERRTTLVIAMHDLDRAISIATRIIVLAGRPATVAYRAEIDGLSDAGRAALRLAMIDQFPFLSDVERRKDDDGLSVLPLSG